jgi:hypothetical protein
MKTGGSEMTQLEILKYAYVGALETVESLRKSTIGDEESRKQRLEAADRDFKEIRDMMFKAIGEETGIEFDEAQDEAPTADEAKYGVYLKSEGGTWQLYMSDLTEKEAERVCNEHDWSFEDENGFVWAMEYEKQPF